jgi:uncharacterized repeat protein (TIGR03806 family)
LVLLLGFGPAAEVRAQAVCTSGPRVPFAGHDFPLDSLPDPTPLAPVQTYQNVALDQPVLVTAPPDGTGRLFVVERSGRIRILPQDEAGSQAPVFLDLSNEISLVGEQGLLGLAFDPAYATNRRFYVDYIASDANCQAGVGWSCTKIARFEARASNPSQADPATKTVLLEARRGNTIHNGGMLAFSPVDGMLYISQGDDGDSSNAQNLNVLLGKMLRIDVRGSSYAIPPDNPFVGQANRRGEIWAYGLRNPWRWSFDRLTGDLWIGDVGQDAWEEVDYLPAGTPGGTNFGWPFCEGTHDQGGNTCASIQSTLPLLEYPHNSSGGFAVTGGYVYRGDRLPSLYGAYIYGDWALGYIRARATLAGPSVDVANIPGVASFGEGPDADLYAVVPDGAIFKFQETTSGGGQQFPTTLSGTGLFSNVATLTPAPGLVEYDVISPLWSDRAVKRRWIALPAGQQVTFSANGDWSFPVGTVFVKHFDLPLTPTTTRRLETRVLLRQIDRWVGYTYRWNSTQTDATLLTQATTDTFTVDMGSGATQQTWQYPSPADCLSCHTSAAGRVLGVRTEQLNRDFAYPGGSDNELDAWGRCLSLFTEPIAAPSFYPALADPANAAAPLGERARAYLASNCSHCHRPYGPAPGALDMRARVLLGAMNLIGVTPTEGDLGIVGAQRIRVGSKGQSVLWERIQSTDLTERMPLGSRVPDPLAVSLLGSWIDTGLGVIDSDGDSVPDSSDNCPYEPNATQTDSGGWMSSVADGAGDACQCANATLTGAITIDDMSTLRQYLAGNTGFAIAGLPRRSSFADPEGRPSVLDVTHLRRALAGTEPPIPQICPAATQLAP